MTGRMHFYFKNTMIMMTFDTMTFHRAANPTIMAESDCEDVEDPEYLNWLKSLYAAHSANFRSILFYTDGEPSGRMDLSYNVDTYTLEISSNHTSLCMLLTNDSMMEVRTGIDVMFERGQKEYGDGIVPMPTNPVITLGGESFLKFTTVAWKFEVPTEK